MLTSALSGIDQALWDIKGKALGVPVYELLGGPTRSRVRVYAHAPGAKEIKQQLKKGFTAFKTGPAKRRPSRYIETPARSHTPRRSSLSCARLVGEDADLGIDFHGGMSPALAKLLIKALEPYHPMFIEEPCQCQNVDVMADIARGTHLPIATGERDLHQVGLPRDPREAGGGDPPARPLPRRRHHRSAAHRRDGRGLLRHHRPAQPARADLAGRRGPARRRRSPTSSARSRSSLGEGYLKKPFRVQDGYLDLPTAPGLGIELDDDALADKMGHDWRNPESYDADDGSVMDW